MPVQFDSNYPNLTVNLIFPAPIGTQEVTTFVERATLTRGRARETDRYAGSGTIELSNWDGRFTPANLSSPYVSGGVSFVRPRVGVQVQAVWNSITYNLFRGFITNWQDVFSGQGRDTRTVISFTDATSLLAACELVPLAAAVGAGERPGPRISRILTAAAWPLTTSLADGSLGLQPTTLGGNAFSLVQQVADTEGGAFWCEGDGQLVFEDRAALATNSRSNTSQVTFSDASVFFRDATTSQSDDLLYNAITHQREGGVPQVASDGTSIGLYGRRGLTRTGLLAEADPDIAGLSTLLLSRYKDPEYRVDRLTIDPHASPSLLWPHALGRRIRDRATVTATVLRNGLTITRDVFIEGVTHDVAQNRWATSFAFSSATAWNSIQAARWDTGQWGSAVWFY